MKMLYIDCSMGAAGDMLSSALLELFPDREETLKKLNSLGLQGVEYTAESVKKSGVSGTRLTVKYLGHEEGAGEAPHLGRPKNIFAAVHSLSAPEAVKENVEAVFGLIADAESAVHGQKMEDVHFHELGTMDALADVTAFAWLLNALAPDKTVFSPVCVGYGQVECAHGILPVPAPATALLLKGVPAFAGDVEGELCTPTGAALIKYFGGEYSRMPEMTARAVGCGMGSRDYKRPSMVRAFMGQGEDQAEELCFNVDDMSPEAVSFAMDILRSAGAKDVSWQSVGMKKSRPGLLVRVICAVQDTDEMIRLIFRHTTTIGIRQTLCTRFVLKRKSGLVTTPWGPVRVKSSRGWGTEITKPEFDDVADIAKSNGLTYDEVAKTVTGGRGDA